jgi:RNA polymerase-binding transcription factor DksA
MNTVNPPNQWARLIKRRTEITMTLRHVEFERKNIEAKEASMDRDARARRLTMLRDLNDWYAREIDQVEQALRRVDQNNSGVCIACRAPISAERLEDFPETELCAGCQNFQEQRLAD